MRVLQFVHTLSYGDAISTEVLAIDRCVRQQNRESLIVALNTHPAYRGRTINLGDEDHLRSGGDGALGNSQSGVTLQGVASNAQMSIRDRAARLVQKGDCVILHYSIGSPLNEWFRECDHARRCMIYHNITPAKWFRGVNPRVARDIDNGVEDLARMCALADAIWADSTFNAEEIVALGFDAKKLQLLVEPSRWSAKANEGILQLLRSDNSFHLLHVGRLAPNKCIEDILKIFYFFHHYVEPKSVLWLVGIDTDTELYSFALKRFAYELGISEAVRFVGSVADGELRAFYEGSTAYICMSEHEGFCLPVLEAMEFGLPVVAYGAGAIPETIGRGGILVREKHHAHIAELLGMLRPGSDMRRDVVARGKEQAACFRPEIFEKRLADLLMGLGQECVVVASPSQATAPGSPV